jgi:hypothetical protein
MMQDPVHFTSNVVYTSKSRPSAVFSIWCSILRIDLITRYYDLERLQARSGTLQDCKPQFFVFCNFVLISVLKEGLYFRIGSEVVSSEGTTGLVQWVEVTATC